MVVVVVVVVMVVAVAVAVAAAAAAVVVGVVGGGGLAGVVGRHVRLYIPDCNKGNPTCSTFLVDPTSHRTCGHRQRRLISTILIQL